MTEANYAQTIRNITAEIDEKRLSTYIHQLARFLLSINGQTDNVRQNEKRTNKRK